MKKFARQRFIERTLNPPSLIREAPKDLVEVVPVVEQVEEAGRIITRSLSKRVPVEDKFKGYKVSDFHMQNVIAAGAVANLSECYYNGQPLDSLEASLIEATRILDAAPIKSTENQ